MELPKPPEQNIEMSIEDKKNTEAIKNLTRNINDLITERSNEITNFYKNYSSFKIWIDQNKNEIHKFKPMILEKLEILKKHAEKTQEIINNILYTTQNQEKIDSQKIMIKIKLDSDFSQEKTFAKELHYPHEIINLAKEISINLNKSKNELIEDLEVEKKAEELLLNMKKMIENILIRLNNTINIVSQENNLDNLNPILQILVDDINREKIAFEKLNRIEQIHLHLLLDLFEKEDVTVKEEKEFIKDEERISPKL